MGPLFWLAVGLLAERLRVRRPLGITLDGERHEVQVPLGASASEVAWRIASRSYPGWTVTRQGTRVWFAENEEGAVRLDVEGGAR